MKALNKNFIVIIPIMLLLVLVPIASFIMPDHLISKTENRGLAQFPVIDLHDIKSCTTGMENYVVEQFPGREELLKAYTISELIQNKKLIRGTYIAGNQWLLPREFKTTPVEALSFVASLQDFSNQYPDIPFFFAILPHKTTLLASIDSKYISDENGEIHHTYLLDQLLKFPQINVLDVAAKFETLSTTEKEEAYFRTDFHWNAIGAYRAADFILKGICGSGILSQEEIFNKSDFIFSNLNNVPYQGDLNLRFSDLFSMTEQVPLIASRNLSALKYFMSVDDDKPVEREAVIESGIAKKIVSYNDIYTNNLGFYRVDNMTSKSNKRILILKDSLQNPTTDFFSEVFREVSIIDARYYDEPYSIQELIELRKPDIILVMLHHDNYSQELVKLLHE